MLPLCLRARHPLRSLQRVQLQGHEAVLIQNSVARKAGAEILVAGLYRKPTRFKNSSDEPTGEQLVAFESVPIGDPDQNEEVALRELHIATFHSDVREGGKSTNTRLTAEQMRLDLQGHFESERIGPQRPCYCAVELASSEMDRQNQARLIAGLKIPDLLFIGLKPESDTRADLEQFVITCLNTRFKAEPRGFPS